MTISRAYALTGCLLLLSLAACSEVRDTLGIGRNPPDEFAVVDRPPLAMPPDYALRPPQPGAPRPQETTTAQRASAALFGTEKTTTAGTASSTGEKALLESAGASRADPNIRNVVDREASQKVVGSRHLVDELLWWRKSSPSGTTVDAKAEAERIRDAKEKGESVSQGATPIIERQKGGWLGL